VGRKLILKLEYDLTCDSPAEASGWKLYSFERGSGVDPRAYVDTLGRPADVGIRRKLDAGTAFWLSCYDHSSQIWALYGEGPQIDRQWDYIWLAGILVWAGNPRDLPRGREARADAARTFLKTYNLWANGGCYGYVLADAQGGLVDACWGFIGIDGSGMDDYINDNLQEGDELVVVGECADLVEYLDLKAPVVEGEVETVARLRA